jgi:hypothetical protein
VPAHVQAGEAVVSAKRCSSANADHIQIAEKEGSPEGMDRAPSSLRDYLEPAPPLAEESELTLHLDAFGYNPTHLVQLTSTTSH